MTQRTRTIQLPVDIADDIKLLAAREAARLNLGKLSRVEYLRRLVAQEKDRK